MAREPRLPDGGSERLKICDFLRRIHSPFWCGFWRSEGRIKVILPTRVRRSNRWQLVHFDLSCDVGLKSRSPVLLLWEWQWISLMGCHKRHVSSPCWNLLRILLACRPLLILGSRAKSGQQKQCGVPDGNPALFCDNYYYFLFHHKSTTVFPLRKPKIEIGYKCVLHRLYFEYTTYVKKQKPPV